jgi:hypothetical protein
LRKLLHHFLLLVGLLLIFATGDADAFPTMYGGEGGILVQSAEIIPPMSLDISMYGLYAAYFGANDPGGAEPVEDQQDQTELSLSGNIGLFQYLQVGLVAPFIMSGGQGGSGLGQATFVAKSAFLPSNRNGFNFGLTVNAKAPVSDENLGSGELNYSGEINLSYWFPTFSVKPSLHVNFGYGKFDYYIPYWDVEKRDFTFWHATPTIIGSGALKLALLESLEGSIEGVFRSYQDENAEESDEDLFATIGLRGIVGQQFTINGGVSFGLPDALRANTDLQIILGASLLLLPPEMLTTGPTEAPSAVDDYVSAEDAAQQEQLNAMRKKPLKSLRIKIVAGCRNQKKTNMLAKKMIMAGFNITEIGDVKGKYKLSRIVFTEPFSRQAVSLARILPGKQKINRSSKKIPGADIVIIVGCDFMRKKKPKDTAPSRPLAEATISIMETCGNIENAKNAARVLIMEGITNLVGIDSSPTINERKYSVIQFKPGFLRAAGKVSKILPGRQKVARQKDPTAADIVILVGCSGVQ